MAGCSRGESDVHPQQDGRVVERVQAVGRELEVEEVADAPHECYVAIGTVVCSAVRERFGFDDLEARVEDIVQRVPTTVRGVVVVCV